MKTTATSRWVVVALLAASGCGGSDKQAVEPAAAVEPELDSEGEGEDDVLYPPEKLDEIQRTFDNKRSVISRCHPEGVNAGELVESDVVEITVGLTIGTDGKPRNVRVVQSSKKSAALEACVKDKVASWVLPTLPKDLEYSFAYRLGQL